MKRNMNLKATAGILLAQATMLGAIAAPTVTALADEGDAKQFTVATVRWTDAWSNALRDFGPKYMNPEFYDKVIIPDDVSDGIKLKEDEVNAKYVTTDKNTGMPALQYTEDELNRITAIGTDVYSYVESMYAHWVVDGGVEDEWDSYIDQLNAMGLEELVSLQQGAYAAYLESME